MYFFIGYGLSYGSSDFFLGIKDEWVIQVNETRFYMTRQTAYYRNSALQCIIALKFNSTRKKSTSFTPLPDMATNIELRESGRERFASKAYSPTRNSKSVIFLSTAAVKMVHSTLTF